MSYDDIADENAHVRWTVRSLTKGLSMLQYIFSPIAQGWGIRDLTDLEPSIMELEHIIRHLLLTGYCHVDMLLKKGSPELEKYSYYCFFIVSREENERPPTFTFTEEDEAMIPIV